MVTGARHHHTTTMEEMEMKVYTLQLNGKLIVLDADKTDEVFDILPVFSTPDKARGYLDSFGALVAGEPKGRVKLVSVGMDFVRSKVRRTEGLAFALDHRGRSQDVLTD